MYSAVVPAKAPECHFFTGLTWENSFVKNRAPLGARFRELSGVLLVTQNAVTSVNSHATQRMSQLTNCKRVAYVCGHPKRCWLVPRQA
jgi:hypothetical protein